MQLYLCFDFGQYVNYNFFYSVFFYVAVDTLVSGSVVRCMRDSELYAKLAMFAPCIYRNAFCICMHLYIRSVRQRFI